MVGGMRWWSSVISVITASTAPAADSVWPIIDLLEEIGTSRGAFAEHRGHGKAFHLVVFRRAGAMGVDVVDVVRR